MSEPDVREIFGGLRAHLDPAPADWVVLSLKQPWLGEEGFTVASLLPPHYDRYVRILHPAGTNRWADIASAGGRTMHPAVQFTKLIPSPQSPHGYDQSLPHPRQGTLESGALAALADVLLRHTVKPEAGWFCMWNGFGGLPHEVARSYAVVRAWSRSYILLSGPVSAINRFEQAHLDGPQIWWPEDRAWCVASEIDFDSTIVAGSARLTDEVLRHPGLEVLPVERATALDYVGDEINPGTMSEEELERLRQQL